jgi:hypothetical protein
VRTAIPTMNRTTAAPIPALRRSRKFLPLSAGTSSRWTTASEEKELRVASRSGWRTPTSSLFSCWAASPSVAAAITRARAETRRVSA